MSGEPHRPPPWMVGAKALLAALLVVGALFPDVGGFAGKGMAFRLPVFLLPALVVPAWWRWRRARSYPIGLDTALTVPFLLDTAANAVGLYDHVDATDDVLHALNWIVLVGGVVHTIAHRVTAAVPTWLLVTAGSGIGAIAIIGWEVAEYLIMQAGVGGLALTYGDALGDLVLSTTGGLVGALLVVRWVRPRSSP